MPVTSDTYPFKMRLLIKYTRVLELLFVKQTILCWAILIIKYSHYFLKVAAWRSPHQSPTNYFCYPSTSFCDFSQCEKETSHAQSDWSFNCNSPGTTIFGRFVQRHIGTWLTQTAKLSATFRLLSVLLSKHKFSGIFIDLFQSFWSILLHCLIFAVSYEIFSLEYW